MLQQAWNEGIRPVLVLNKIDRLITEVKLAPLDAYVHLGQVLEQVNAVLGELFTEDVMSKWEQEKKERDKKVKEMIFFFLSKFLCCRTLKV